MTSSDALGMGRAGETWRRTFGMASVFHWMGEYGIGVTETDKVFGPPMGRPKSAVFRTADVVGLDTLAHVLATVQDGVPDDPWRDRFATPPFMARLIASGALGEKSGAGFYKKTRDASGARQILALDPAFPAVARPQEPWGSGGSQYRQGV